MAMGEHLAGLCDFGVDRDSLGPCCLGRASLISRLWFFPSWRLVTAAGVWISPLRPSAVLARSDRIAVAVVETARKVGLRIPEQLA
jgi:hypothetical protein